MKRIIVSLALLAAAQLAYADGGKMKSPPNALWQEECGSCHSAFPPRLLTEENWIKLMSGLDKHFGDNAELNVQDRQAIEDYLTRYAGSGARHSAASLRITETPWFVREHRSISPKEWVHPQVKSRANCTACHQTIAQGRWSEHDISVPGRGRWSGNDDDD
ncbi:MAG: diheme cytochrome c [Gammaproteobacteria bacterium]|nr:diheme cytochrome c [Gammaproteobacteria bacterium]MBU1447101.1 diheme cytochrome c [Gammaproteobacteria bacterium]